MTNDRSATPESLGIDPARLEALFERARREVDAGILPSCQLAVARHGKLAAVRALGRARFGGGASPGAGAERDVDPSTLYVIFSCTKAITSAAGWLLLQEGKLGLDERVADVLPGFEANGKGAVTVEQLFTHTAGFPSAPSGPQDWASSAAMRARFARWRLNWEPGSRFEYHPSSSMWVIAALIEERSGVSFRDFVRARIAEPLGLPDLFVGTPAAQCGRVADIVHSGTALTAEDFRARGWPVPPETEVTEEAVERFNRDDVRAVGVPGGGATTNAASLALFYQALLDGRTPDGNALWAPETLALARSVRTGDLVDPMFGKRVHRGLGVCIAGDADRTFRGFGHGNSEHAFGHGGAGGQIAWADPATGLSFAYLTNGFDREVVRQARRGVGLSSRAATLCGE
jgi:CubicO group peptidase (beta-lactamase class C family)